MKVLLTQPLTVFLNEPPNIPDSGLGCIATSLRNNGHGVDIRDRNMNPSARDFKKSLAANKPEIIGIKRLTSFLCRK